MQKEVVSFPILAVLYAKFRAKFHSLIGKGGRGADDAKALKEQNINSATVSACMYQSHLVVIVGLSYVQVTETFYGCIRQ